MHYHHFRIVHAPIAELWCIELGKDLATLGWSTHVKSRWHAKLCQKYMLSPSRDETIGNKCILVRRKMTSREALLRTQFVMQWNNVTFFVYYLVSLFTYFVFASRQITAQPFLVVSRPWVTIIIMWGFWWRCIQLMHKTYIRSFFWSGSVKNARWRRIFTWFDFCK